MQIRAVATVLCALVYLTPFAAAQTATPAAPDRAQVLKAAREIMQAARYCVLVTLGEDGHPQARIMDPFLPEGDMTIWAATNSLTRKVGEIKKDPRVTLVYFDSAKMAYVTLLGTAALVSNAGEKAKHWKDEWAKIYKDGSRSDEYLLIRIKPTRLEISSAAHGLNNDPKTWKPVIIEFK